jgi:hypothetical protein
MNDGKDSNLVQSAGVVRWIARVLSAVILGFWGFFIVGHLVGDQGEATRPLNTNDYIGLAAMAASLAGLALAWKWEFAGGAITLVAVLIGAAVNWRVLLFPGTLIPLAAVLFLACWWMSRSPHEPRI